MRCDCNFARAQRALLGLLAITATVAAPAAFAAFPDKPLRLVVPFPPGGGTDLIARTLGASMAIELGVAGVVANRPGAGTIIGTELVATFAHVINPSMQPKLPYVWDKAFAPVILIGRGPNVLVVAASSPYRNLQDVIAAARARPGKLSYASFGYGTSGHLAGEMFTNLAKVDITHVPYKGAAQAITDILGGQPDMIFGTAAAVASFIGSGKLRPVGVTSPARSPSLPGIPAIGESVIGYSVESWYGIYAPAGTPPDIIARLNAAIGAAAKHEEFRRRIEPEGIQITAGKPAELDEFVRAEEARWRRIVRENNIKPE